MAGLDAGPNPALEAGVARREEGVSGREQRLRRLDDEAVVGVDDVGDGHLRICEQSRWASMVCRPGSWAA